MIDILKSFKSLIKLDQVQIDNNVFKLHYKVTVIMLLAFSVMLTSKQYFGDPIMCDVPDRELVNIFCWITGTFINMKTLTDDVLPGLGQVMEKFENVNRQSYYQWVCVVFCMQAMIFYLPRFLWKTWEGGRLKLLLTGLPGPIQSPNWNTVTRDRLIHYLLKGRCAHNIYVVRYSICEILNFLNVIGQIYFIDWFITGNFSMYGIAYASYSFINPMTRVFPKLTKCLYRKYGPSGSIQTKDALCILPLNVLNEKFFLVLWYWLFVLLLVSFCSLIYRALFLFVPKFRVYLLRAQTRNVDTRKARLIVDNITYGDFFILYKIGKNINPIMYKELVFGIHDYIINKGKSYNKNIDEV